MKNMFSYITTFSVKDYIIILKIRQGTIVIT